MMEVVAVIFILIVLTAVFVFFTNFKEIITNFFRFIKWKIKHEFFTLIFILIVLPVFLLLLLIDFLFRMELTKSEFWKNKNPFK